MMHNKNTTCTITDLLGHRIVTADGKQLGHVADLQLSPAPEYKVIALIYGASGWFYRLHVLSNFAGIFGLPPQPGEVAWDDIARIESGIITLKSTYKAPNNVK